MTAPLGHPTVPSPFPAPEKPNPATRRGLALLRSGARRSQEQGESRMTVLPGARNRKPRRLRDPSRLRDAYSQRARE